MFNRILIANRGEIACRIIATARRLGIETVAVYSDIDAGTRHVELADEAVRIGGAAPRDSYLRGEVILDAAQRRGCEAIHPGYGFLSENADFAELCRDGGVVFVGPTADALRLMGSKREAKALMEQAGVATVPGYHGEDQDPDRLRVHAEHLGYPILIKAAAGGGGKGMRVVRAPADFDDALAAARREAQAAFADTAMIIERYLLDPRHIEVQVFADRFGNVVHLFERDCSIQRRHQKIVEETPAPGMEHEWRERIGATAIGAAQAIGYLGAGTVEFLVQDDVFYFMEMNTRLQVEHPVTELVTGQDLVEWQLRVAAGELLPCGQDALRLNGHAIEARIYAEDPARDFLPSTGTLTHLRLPPADAHVRVDTGVRAGDSVSLHYDPLVAKLIVWGADRSAAQRRLRTALRTVQIVGVANNVEFLKRLVAHPTYAAGGHDTRFVDLHREALLERVEAPIADNVFAVACLFLQRETEQAARSAARRSADPFSPWSSVTGWRLNEESQHTLHFRHRAGETRAVVRCRGERLGIELPTAALAVEGRLDDDGDLVARVDDVSLRATVIRRGQALTVFAGGQRFELSCFDPDRVDAEEEALAGVISAPMPGRIVEVRVGRDATVRRGDVLLVIEAMKMEHAIRAPADGIVTVVAREAGDVVEDGEELLVLATQLPTP